MMNAVLLSIFVLFGSISAAAESLSLQQALQIALQNNQQIKAGQSVEEAAKSELDSAKGKYFPRLDLIATYIHMQEDIALDARIPPLPPLHMVLQKQDFGVAALALTQPLYTGGKITANERAKKENYLMAQSDSENTKSKVLADLVGEYFQVKLAGRNRDVRQNSLDALKEHQRISDSLLKQGQLSQAMKMKVDVAVLEAEADLLKATREEGLAKKVLANSLNRPDISFDLTTDLQMPTIAPMEKFVEKASTSNNSIRQLEHKKILLEQKHKAEMANDLPTVAVTGAYQVNRDLAEVIPDWYVGVLLTMNVFEGFSGRNSLKAISQEKVALNSMEGHAKNLVQIGVEKQYSDVLSAKEQYEAYQKSESLAAEVVRLNTASYKNGFARATDVLDSELVLTATKLKMQKALYDYNTSYVQLLHLSGMSEEIQKLYQ